MKSFIKHSWFGLWGSGFSSLSSSVWTRSWSEFGTFCVGSGNVSSETFYVQTVLLFVLASVRWYHPLAGWRTIPLLSRADGRFGGEHGRVKSQTIKISVPSVFMRFVMTCANWHSLLAPINTAAENCTIKQYKHDGGDDDGCIQQPVRIWKFRGKLDSPVQLLMTINGATGRPIGFLAAARWEVVSLPGVSRGGGGSELMPSFPTACTYITVTCYTSSCRAPGGHDPHWEDASEQWACQHHSLDSGGLRWISIFLLLWLVSYL